MAGIFHWKQKDNCHLTDAAIVELYFEVKSDATFIK